MDIAHLDPPSFGAQGDYIYRTAQPCRALGRLSGVRVLCGTWLSPTMRAACVDAEVLILNNAIDMDLLPLLARRKKHGLCTVYEINDDLSVPHEANHQRSFYDSVENRSLFFQLVRRCEGVQFTSQKLQEKYGFLNATRRVFPNQLWSVPPARKTPGGEGRVRLGWAGSEGHLADMKAIAPALIQFIKSHPQVDLAIMGAPAIAELFSGLPSERLQVVGTSDLQGYLAFLSQLDIGVAPLLPTEFNLGRSDVKYLEYASSSVAAVCQRVGPYGDTVRDGVDGLLFSNKAELFGALERMLDGGQRATLVEAAYRQVSESRLEQPHAQQRLNFYQSLLAEPVIDQSSLSEPIIDGTGSGASGTEISPFAQAYTMGTDLDGGDGVVGQAGLGWARHLELSSSESALLDALLAQASGGDGSESTARARELFAYNYLTEFYSARVAADYEGPLLEAQELEGHACAPPYLLGLRRLADGRVLDAKVAFEQALRIHRELAPVWFQLGRCHEALESSGAAQHAYRQAVLINSDFDPGIHALARLQMKLGKGREAAQTLQHMATDVSRGRRTPSADHWLLLGKAHLMAGDLSASTAALVRVLELAPERHDVMGLLEKINKVQDRSAGPGQS